MENNHVKSRSKTPLILIILLIILLLLAAAVAGLTYLFVPATGSLQSMNLAEPLNDTASAEFSVDLGDGNLNLDGNSSDGGMLATGNLEYLENVGEPGLTVSTFNGHTQMSLTVGDGQRWLKLPWSVCNGATEWTVTLNPSVVYEISAFTGGGNVKLNLAGLTVTKLNAESGGGNMEVTLPDNAENLAATVKTGAGKVNIQVGGSIKGSHTIEASSGAGEMNVLLPKGTVARVKVSMGEVQVSPEFIKIDDSTYETAGYQSAVDRVEITVGSGLGKADVRFN